MESDFYCKHIAAVLYAAEGGLVSPTRVEDSWEEQLSQIVDTCRDGYRYINYRHADEFYCAMNSFVEDRFSILFSSGRILPAFNLVCTVFCTAMAEEADDSDGGISS